jgi:hypothetical protein
MNFITSKHSERYMPAAKDQDKTEQMITMFRVAESKDELEQITLLFLFDMSYDRGDICLAIGIVEREKGWH